MQNDSNSDDDLYHPQIKSESFIYMLQEDCLHKTFSNLVHGKSGGETILLHYEIKKHFKDLRH